MHRRFDTRRGEGHRPAGGEREREERGEGREREREGEREEERVHHLSSTSKLSSYTNTKQLTTFL